MNGLICQMLITAKQFRSWNFYTTLYWIGTIIVCCISIRWMLMHLSGSLQTNFREDSKHCCQFMQSRRRQLRIKIFWRFKFDFEFVDNYFPNVVTIDWIHNWTLRSFCDWDCDWDGHDTTSASLWKFSFVLWMRMKLKLLKRLLIYCTLHQTVL